MMTERLDGWNWRVVDKTSTPRKIAVEIRFQEAGLQKSIHPLYLALRDTTH
jgi:hypothetical protein